MADEIQLKVSADIKEVNSAITATKKFEKQITNTVKALNDGKITNKAYNQSLLEIKRGYQEYSTSSQKATADVRKMAKAVQEETKISKALANQKKIEVAQKKEEVRLYKQARAEAERENQSRTNSIKNQVRQEASLERLKAKFKPLYAASKQYETALNEINQAHKLGVISINQQTTAVDRLNAEYKQGTGIFSEYSAQARRGTNQLGVAVQQTGYQVGDFLVQVQSGTNPLVAFGQQATQLVGILPLVATQLGLTAMAAIGISTALGIGIPLVTALGAAFMRTKTPTKNLEEIMSDLSTAVGDYSSNMESASLSTDDLNTKFGAFGETAKGVLETMLEISRVNMQKSVQAVSALGPLSPKALKSIGESGRLQTSQQDVIADMFPMIKRMLGKMGTAKGGRLLAAQFADMLIKLEKAEGVEAQLEVLNKISDFTKTVGGTYEDMTDQQQEFFAKVTEARNLLLKTVEAEEKASARVEKAKKDAFIEAANVRYRAAKNIADAELEEAVRIYKERIKKETDIEDAATDLMLARYEHQSNLIAAQKDREIAEAVKIYKDRLKKEKEYEEIVEKLMLEGYEHQAELTAAQKKAELDAAVEIYKKRKELQDAEADRLATFYANLSLSQSPYGVNMGQIEGAVKIYNDSDKEGPKGKEPTTMEGPIKALERQIELSKALFGLEGDARREQEVYMQLKFQNQDVDIEAGEKELRSLAGRVALEEQRTKVLEEQNKVIEEQRQAQEALADSIAGSMGDAFMSIVDGTMSVKDAFKSMARAIIKELYEVLIVQQLVGSAKAGSRSGIAGGIMNFFGSANGNAMYNGNVIPFANGGVVSGPTTFPMSAGRTGLMGEAGPEAIMPLKRGANGKLGVQSEGGSGDVVIHQNFNFQANGDDSVKRIIAQAAPQIAQMTKSSIISDRRRGGQMKATFG